jgi:hypothetical protein
MDKIKFSLFDIFAYAIPGAVALLAGIIFFDKNLVQLSNFATTFQNATVAISLVALIVSYTIGCAVDTLGSLLYYKIGCRIWGEPYDRKSKRLSNTIERALVRHFSPENHSYLQTWKIVKTMSHNFSFTFLLLGLTTIIKTFQVPLQHQWEWIFLTILSLLISIIFLNRASIFDKWYYRDLTETVQSLHLEQRALESVKVNE